MLGRKHAVTSRITLSFCSSAGMYNNLVLFHGFICYLTISCLCPTKLCNANSQWVAFSGSLSLCVIFHISGSLPYVMWITFSYVTGIGWGNGLHLNVCLLRGSLWMAVCSLGHFPDPWLLLITQQSSGLPAVFGLQGPTYQALWDLHWHVHLLVCEHHLSPTLDFMCCPHSHYLKENFLG